MLDGIDGMWMGSSMSSQYIISRGADRSCTMVALTVRH